MRGRFLKKPRAAFSLIEISIASAILWFVTIVVVSGLLMADRMSRSSLEEMMALEVLNRELESIRAAPNYGMLGVPVNGLNTQGYAPEEALAREGPVPRYVAVRRFSYDPTMENGPEFRVSYQWYGSGRISNYNGTDRITYQALDGSNADWSLVDFTGASFQIRSGSGAGQMANITDHLPGTDQLVLNADLNGYASGGQAFMVQPDASSVFEINGGKLVRIRVAWDSRFGPPRESIRWVFVPSRTP